MKKRDRSAEDHVDATCPPARKDPRQQNVRDQDGIDGRQDENRPMTVEKWHVRSRPSDEEPVDGDEQEKIERVAQDRAHPRSPNDSL